MLCSCRYGLNSVFNMESSKTHLSWTPIMFGKYIQTLLQGPCSELACSDLGPRFAPWMTFIFLGPDMVMRVPHYSTLLRSHLAIRAFHTLFAWYWQPTRVVSQYAQMWLPSVPLMSSRWRQRPKRCSKLPTHAARARQEGSVSRRCSGPVAKGCMLRA